MANPSRAKGTRYENELRDRLRPIFPAIERAPLKGVNDEGDFVNVPFPIEAKNTERPRIPEWCRRLRKVAGARWVLFWTGGDRRRSGHPGEVAVLPAPYARWLLALEALLDEGDQYIEIEPAESRS